MIQSLKREEDEAEENEEEVGVWEEVEMADIDRCKCCEL